MDGLERAAVVPVLIAVQLEARHHRVAELAFDEVFVGQPAGEVLQGGDDARVRDEQELAVVVELVGKRFDPLVHVKETFPVREAEPAQVLQPGVHLATRDGGQLLAFPRPEVDLLDGVRLFDWEPCCLGYLFGKAVGAQERAREQPCRFGSGLQEVLDGSRGFAFEGGGDVKVEPAIADVVRVVGLGVSDRPKNHFKLSSSRCPRSEVGDLLKRKSNPRVAKKVLGDPST